MIIDKKTYELFICGGLHYVTDSLCKHMLKCWDPNLSCELHTFYRFSSYYQYMAYCT